MMKVSGGVQQATCTADCGGGISVSCSGSGCTAKDGVGCTEVDDNGNSTSKGCGNVA